MVEALLPIDVHLDIVVSEPGVVVGIESRSCIGRFVDYVIGSIPHFVPFLRHRSTKGVMKCMA